MAPPGRGKRNGTNETKEISRSMQRSNTNSSTSSSETCKCSCRHPHDFSGLASPPSKSSTRTVSGMHTTALRRQKELRDFALIDRLLSRIFWLRFYEDAARLYSTRLTLIAKERLPFFVQNIIASGGGPGWTCANAGNEEIREFFRLQIQVDLRELEDRLWHVSSEWTYTAIRRMAISNGVIISPAGLRVTELLTLVPLLEAMCEGLENAPTSVYEIHPHQAIAATFLNLTVPPNQHSRPNKKQFSGSSGLQNMVSQTQSLCSHHPLNGCALEGIEGGIPIWGPSLYRITSSALSDPNTPTSLKAGMPTSPASVLFDALFPPSMSPNGTHHSPKTGKILNKSSKAGFTDTEMLHAQAELRSILSLGLSRLFIVLFQTAAEFNLRSFGENVNLAFGGSGSAGIEKDGELYRGCECCLEDHFQHQYGRRSGVGHSPLRTNGNLENAIDDPLYDIWADISKPPPSSSDPSPEPLYSKSKIVKRRGAGHNSNLISKDGPYANTRYRHLYSPKPGAGLKAWDTVLHYEAVIREEEDEKTKLEDEKKAEREKYGLKANISLNGSALINGPNAAQSIAGNVDEMLLDEKSNRRGGKGREGNESDGRGGGLLGWNSCHEEDLWERDLDSGDDFGIEDYFSLGLSKDPDDEMSSSCRCRRVAMRYLLAEEYKEDGNAAFKRGDYKDAIAFYTRAHKSEPRFAIYLLNRAMASLKLYRWKDAELDCSAVLRKHRTNAKAIWRRAKARRSLAQLTGDIEKLIEAERDLLDFLAILPNSFEGYSELASVRAELCPCFECSEQSDSLLFCSTSSTAPPTSCFNRGYRPPAFLFGSSTTTKALFENGLSRSAHVFGAPPKGWLATPIGSPTGPATPTTKAKVAKNATQVNKTNGPASSPTARNPPHPPSFNVPWFKTTPTGADRGIWQAFVQDFSLLPESVSSSEDKIPLRFSSDHDLPSSTLPNWDLYRVFKLSK